MAIIGYQASHEQFKPGELLKYVQLAEKAGFSSVNSSDHFHPWSENQGQSGFSFAWLGAAMQATAIPYSVVCSPGQRYHPAIVAQAIATLCEMFPDRFRIFLGTGEAINELITGEKWPKKSDRNQRLYECAGIIRKLLQGETVNHDGMVKVENAKLYTLPASMPLLLGAAVSKYTAAWLGTWADGLITVSKPFDELKEVVEAFRNNGGAGKPVYLKTQISYSRSEENAYEGAFHQWKTNIFKETILADLPGPAHFDALAKHVQMDDVAKMVRISSKPEEHIQWIKKDMELGFEQIILHNVNREQEDFIADFGSYVLPELNK